MKDAYDSDFYAWANRQAALLRAGRLDEADIEHIAEEVESMARASFEIWRIDSRCFSPTF